VRNPLIWLAAFALLGASPSRPALGQRPDSIRVRDSILANGITAGESDAERPRRQLINQAKFDFGWTTMTIGGGLLVDYGAFDQDSLNREQVHDVLGGKLRDARVLLGGKFKSKRPFTWQIGVMYDQLTNKWLFRQTGLMVAFPEAWGHLFIGRAKEGFSMNKVMVGYDGWSMERLPFTDATVPLLADGIKWMGNTPDRHYFWNLGAFMDALSEGQTFSSYNYQFVVRTGWVPMVADTAGTLLEMAMNFRAGDVNNDTLRLRSKPEAFTAPYYVNTDNFPAQSALAFGPEIFYRPGRVLVGAEYYWMKVNSRETGNPWFYGGEFSATWNTTGETRSYNSVGNYFRTVSPTNTVIQGGPGAWELVMKFTYTNLTNGPVQGGQFWRFTPMINWYLTDNLRLEMAYGYGTLNKGGIVGRTAFSQARIQMRL